MLVRLNDCCISISDKLEADVAIIYCISFFYDAAILLRVFRCENAANVRPILAISQPSVVFNLLKAHLRLDAIVVDCSVIR